MNERKSCAFSLFAKELRRYMSPAALNQIAIKTGSMRRKRKCQGQYFLFSMGMAKKCKSALLNLINMPFLDIVARQTIIESKGRTLCTALIHTNLARDVAEQIRESGRGGMGHACEWETSMYLHLNENEVRKERIVDDYDMPDSEFHWNELQDPSPILMMEWWTTFSKSGVSGSATLANKEKGKILYDTTVERLVSIRLILHAGVRLVIIYIQKGGYI
ncbi:creatininase family protein [Aneurinibacillus migulanus]|uniref:creatininase family protein n=1 Tax=Aneurinibacillus migulanus TaxID=47500 RepID=UPI00399CC6B3